MAAIATNNNVVDYKHFWKAFVQAKGATHILIVSTLYSFGIGSVIGLVSYCSTALKQEDRKAKSEETKPHPARRPQC